MQFLNHVKTPVFPDVNAARLLSPESGKGKLPKELSRPSHSFPSHPIKLAANEPRSIFDKEQQQIAVGERVLSN